jgi:hypothetical protein
VILLCQNTKYRQIPTTSKAFAAHLIEHAGALRLLHIAGFRKDNAADGPLSEEVGTTKLELVHSNVAILDLVKQVTGSELLKFVLSMILNFTSQRIEKNVLEIEKMLKRKQAPSDTSAGARPSSGRSDIGVAPDSPLGDRHAEVQRDAQAKDVPDPTGSTAQVFAVENPRTQAAALTRLRNRSQRPASKPDADINEMEDPGLSTRSQELFGGDSTVFLSKSDVGDTDDGDEQPQQTDDPPSPKSSKNVKPSNSRRRRHKSDRSDDRKNKKDSRRRQQ